MSNENLQRTKGGDSVFGEQSGAPFQVDSIESLRAISVGILYDQLSVIVIGYYESGDGGGGFYTYDNGSSAADNGGTVIAPDSGSGRWLRAVSGPVSLKAFGAKFDGVTDDTDAHAAAIGALADLYWPVGTSMVSSIEVTANHNIRTGGSSTIIKQIPGQAIGTPIVSITGGNVQMGDFSGTGNIASDTDEQNHMVQIMGSSGTIDSVTLGVLRGLNIRGDVLYIGGLTACPVTNVTWVAVYGINIYRSLVSITGGSLIHGGLIDGGHCGYRTFNIEPNPGQGDVPDAIIIDTIRGGEIQFAGDNTAVVGTCEIGILDLNTAYQTNPVPNYPFYSTDTGIVSTNIKSVVIGSYTATNKSYASIVAPNPGGNYRGSISIGYYRGYHNDTTADHEMSIAGLSAFKIDSGLSVMNTIGHQFLIGNGNDTSVDISDFTVNGVFAYTAHSVFKNVTTDLTGITGTGDHYYQHNFSTFIGCTGLLGGGSYLRASNGSLIQAGTLTTTTVVNASPDTIMLSTTLNGVAYYDGPISSGYLYPHNFGDYRLWVNTAGKLYIKNGPPAFDTDGTVVGTQS